MLDENLHIRTEADLQSSDHGDMRGSFIKFHFQMYGASKVSTSFKEIHRKHNLSISTDLSRWFLKLSYQLPFVVELLPSTTGNVSIHLEHRKIVRIFLLHSVLNQHTMYHHEDSDLLTCTRSSLFD